MDSLCTGRSILLRAPQDTKPHLWFVLTDPDGTPPRVVAVMLRTVRSYTDPTVILQPGDHPFVSHPSAVHYSSACWFPLHRLARAIAVGECHLKADMSPALLRRVRDGLLASPFTVEVLKQFCRERF